MRINPRHDAQQCIAVIDKRLIRFIKKLAVTYFSCLREKERFNYVSIPRIYQKFNAVFIIISFITHFNIHSNIELYILCVYAL